MTNDAQKQKRFNGTCKICGKTQSVLAARTNIAVDLPRGFAHGRILMSSAIVARDDAGATHLIGSEGAIMRECCGRALSLVEVRGKINPRIECSAKCRTSKGHQCECSCGGKHHGAGFSDV